jgi:hypothetical protein
MVKPRGILNRNAFDQISSGASTSGLFRVTESGDHGEQLIDINGPVVRLQKSSSITPGAGKLTILNGQRYVPEYTLGIGATPGSGYTTTVEGIYLVQGQVAVSGVANEVFSGDVLVDGVAASGNTCLALVGAQGGGVALDIHGIVHAGVGQVLNVGVLALHGDISVIGVEELVIAPAATLTVLQLPSDELSQSGS